MFLPKEIAVAIGRSRLNDQKLFGLFGEGHSSLVAPISILATANGLPIVFASSWIFLRRERRFFLAIRLIVKTFVPAFLAVLKPR
jgi:hypothetical protein